VQAGAQRPVNVWRAAQVERPLMRCIGSEIAGVGGLATSRCTWSAWSLNSTSVSASSAHTAGMMLSQNVSVSPLNTGRRYVVLKTGYA
jgi:hypothetical protein